MGVFDKLKSWLSQTSDKVEKKAEELANNEELQKKLELAKEKLSDAADKLEEVGGSMADKAEHLIQDVKEKGSQKWHELQENEKVKSTVDAVKKGLDDLEDAVEDLGEKVKSKAEQFAHRNDTNMDDVKNEDEEE